MGLDLDCNGKSVHVGSYGNVRFVRHFLIGAIENYVRTSNDEFDETTKKYLLLRLSLCYNDNTMISDLNLGAYNLNGFECFVNHSDCQGYIRSYEASGFVRLCDKLNDFFDKDSIYFRNNKCFLYDIFRESDVSGEDIFFC